MMSREGRGKVRGTMLFKASKPQGRPRDSRAKGARIAANQHLLPLVRFKLVNRQAESVFSVRKLKSPDSLRWRRSLRWRSGKPRYLNRQSAVKRLQAANAISNR